MLLSIAMLPLVLLTTRMLIFHLLEPFLEVILGRLLDPQLLVSQLSLLQLDDRHLVLVGHVVSGALILDRLAHLKGALFEVEIGALGLTV